MMNVAEPKTHRELHGFIGIANHCRDMWVHCSHVLAPLAHFASNKVKWNWGPKQSAAFTMTERIMAKETTLAHPDFDKSFVLTRMLVIVSWEQQSPRMTNQSRSAAENSMTLRPDTQPQNVSSQASQKHSRPVGTFF